MYLDLAQVIKTRLKERNISLNDIIDFNIAVFILGRYVSFKDIETYADESTYAPIVYLDVNTTNGKHEIDLKFTAEMIQDVKAQSGSLSGDLDAFQKELTRITNLNKLLNDQ